MSPLKPLSKSWQPGGFPPCPQRHTTQLSFYWLVIPRLIIFHSALSHKIQFPIYSASTLLPAFPVSCTGANRGMYHLTCFLFLHQPFFD